VQLHAAVAAVTAAAAAAAAAAEAPAGSNGSIGSPPPGSAVNLGPAARPLSGAHPAAGRTARPIATVGDRQKGALGSSESSRQAQPRSRSGDPRRGTWDLAEAEADVEADGGSSSGAVAASGEGGAAVVGIGTKPVPAHNSDPAPAAGLCRGSGDRDGDFWKRSGSGPTGRRRCSSSQLMVGLPAMLGRASGFASNVRRINRRLAFDDDEKMGAEVGACC
jgi:hypothetical protein